MDVYIALSPSLLSLDRFVAQFLMSHLIWHYIIALRNVIVLEIVFAQLWAWLSIFSILDFKWEN